MASKKVRELSTGKRSHVFTEKWTQRGKEVPIPPKFRLEIITAQQAQDAGLEIPDGSAEVSVYRQYQQPAGTLCRDHRTAQYSVAIKPMKVSMTMPDPEPLFPLDKSVLVTEPDQSCTPYKPPKGETEKADTDRLYLLRWLLCAVYRAAFQYFLRLDVDAEGDTTIDTYQTKDKQNAYEAASSVCVTLFGVKFSKEQVVLRTFNICLCSIFLPCSI